MRVWYTLPSDKTLIIDCYYNLHDPSHQWTLNIVITGFFIILCRQVPRSQVNSKFFVTYLWALAFKAKWFKLRFWPICPRVDRLQVTLDLIMQIWCSLNIEQDFVYIFKVSLLVYKVCWWLMLIGPPSLLLQLLTLAKNQLCTEEKDIFLSSHNTRCNNNYYLKEPILVNYR